MTSWLFQYYEESIETITEIGCFEWEFIVDKRNPKKPIIKEYHTRKTESFSRSIYFLEENQNTLFVYLTSGFQLSGQSVIYQFNWNGTAFIKQPKKIFSTIR
ncbi:hypothetical protein [Flavobacterium sp.]|jgi:hypothetical protein|uniref:hypothetical protein n=1 Tax=Flavobacterium sp. TaxID=239 RepID=UPI0037BE357B